VTRRRRIALLAGGAVLLVLAGVLITGVVMVRSGWLREKIRSRVVAEAEKATGGKVEIGALDVDWETLTATVDNLVIRGLEPVGEAPLLAVKRAVIRFKILSFFERQFNVQQVRVESPKAHLIIEPDGSTNMPQPKLARKGKTGPETILDLKVGKFDVTDGAFAVERMAGGKDTRPWSGSGENFAARVTYDATKPRYDGRISVAPVDFAWNSNVRVRAEVTAAAAMEKNQVTVSAATLKTGQSQVDLSNVLVNGFTAPVTTAHYKARVSLADADKVFKLVNFQHSGFVSAEGEMRFVSTADYLATGAVSGEGIGYGKVRNMRVSASVVAAPDDMKLKGIVVRALGGELRAAGEVRKLDDFHLAGTLENFDARVLAGLVDLANLPYDGVLSGPFDATGKLAEPSLHQLVAGATLQIAPGGNGIPVHGEVTAKFSGATNTVELGRSWAELPASRVDVAGVLGQRLDVKFQSHDLRDLAPVVELKTLPATLAAAGGAVAFDGTVTGALGEPRIAGHASVQNALYQGQQIDSAAGDFTAMKTQATVSNAMLASNNLRARVTGSIGLSDWKPVSTSAVSANVQAINADIVKLAAIAGQKDLRMSGTLNATGQIAGTVEDPRVTADYTLSKGQIYDEPYDTVTGHAQYAKGGAQTLTAVVDAGRKHVTANVRFENSDKLTFQVTSNAVAINQIALVRKKEPTLRGTAQVKTDGVVRVARGKPFEIEDLNADVNATGLMLGARNLGNAHLTAETKNGLLTARVDSDVAKSAIHGEGTMRLAGDYPLNGKVTFSGVALSAAAALVRGPDPDARELNLDGTAAGQITVSGPAKALDQMTAAVDIAQIEVHPLRVTGDAKNIPNLTLRNSGAVRGTLSKSTMRIESAHFTAPSTDLSVTGTLALNSAAPINVQVQGTMNLALAETFNADLTSSGQLVVNASVRGSFTNPDVSGRAELQKGEFHLTDFSNGLTNANGLILFSGSRATIQTLSAESGGGKVEVTGFGALAGGANTFRLEAKTRGVRVRYPEGVSTISDSDLTLAGTSERSEASGTVTVRRVSINPKSDISTILAGAAQPLKAPEASNGFLSNMNLDVQVETAPDVAFETSVAQSIEADANLRVRGTAANPAVLGRINITQGELAFFGNKYTINQGVISFFNPAKIDPILNIDLETKARGVDVIITVTGPINKLNASYRSDPPLQFSDIVALLTTGRTPTDPTLAVRDTGQSQSLQQMGASALIGQAIANPVAGRLQRFFGVSRIKIDPQLTGITGSPEARLTIEQQITPELLFTYITDVSSTSTQLIRVEWNFNRRWSAILTREENGYVGLDFAFKKRFK
jgi:translocation and assembly module TamB